VRCVESFQINFKTEATVNKDRAEGKIKDIAGRVQRQAGEWTGDTEAQVKGAVKQAEGKVQNAWGKAKDAVKKANENTKPRAADRGEGPDPEVQEEESDASHRRAV
jgi:uncharacterized protein YjbJ (UPF0337 family)